MAKIKLTTEDRKDLFLYKTRVENLFINEFLPDAPGDYVKVYLFGLMYAQFDQNLETGKLSKVLGIGERDIEEAWVYWESRGLVKRIRKRNAGGEEDESICFTRLVEQLYGKSQAFVQDPSQAAVSDEDAAEDAEGSELIYMSIDDMDYDDAVSKKLTDKNLRELYRKFQAASGRTISRQETGKIEDAVKVYGIEPEVFDYAIDYCSELGKYNIDYIFKVALRWKEEGCSSVADVKELLERHSKRSSWYGMVFKALGFSRLPAPADREIMDRWFDDMQLDISEVLDACSAAAGLRDPNLRYVNKVIENRQLEKGGINTRAEANAATKEAPEREEPKQQSRVSRKVLADYFEHIRAEEDRALAERMREVMSRLPDMREVFEKERLINERMLSLKPGSQSRDERQMMRAERHRIEEEKENLLEANGFAADYLKRRYRCTKCRDSGYTDDGMVCSCCRERAEEAYRWYNNGKSQ